MNAIPHEVLSAIVRSVLVFALLGTVTALAMGFRNNFRRLKTAAPGLERDAVKSSMQMGLGIAAINAMVFATIFRIAW